jgi:hypothetical protein
MRNDKTDTTPSSATTVDAQEDKKLKTKGTQLLMDAIEEVSPSCEFMFQQQGCCDEIETLHNWILLDNQSTVNVFCNSNLVQNIRQATSTLQLKCNAGIVYINRIADLPGFPEPVWFHDNGIANVLSLSRVSKFFPVTYNNVEGFVIHKPDGQKHRFQESPRGLFYLDPSKQSQNKEDTLLVMTVKKKKTAYSKRDVQRAKLARKLQHILGHPSTKQLVKIIEANQLPNCPIGREDVMAAEDIFGKSIAGLKGKTTHKKPDIVTGDYTNLPTGIIEKYRTVTLAFDIMFVNKVAFLVTLSRNIRFGTAE